jgi:glucose-6-phosphate dehydrogenase assembly protein OpcA
MAQPVTASSSTTLATWDAEDATVTQVVGAMDDLRRREERAAVRTSVLTLVVFIDDASQSAGVLDVVHELGARHPSRTIVVINAGEGEGDDGIDASAALNAVDRDGRTVCFDEVVLTVRGRARYHLDSIVEPFTLADLPVAVWSPFHIPSVGNPLLAAADRVVVDTRFSPESADVLRQVAALSRRFPIADLTWVRLTPWRSLLAAMFDGPHLDFTRGVYRVEVTGHLASRALVGGWLLARLGLAPSMVKLTAAEHVSISLDASARGREASFSVRRPSDEKVITASVQVAGGLSQQQTLRMRDQPRHDVLADALSRMGRDPVYEAALTGALQLTR